MTPPFHSGFFMASILHLRRVLVAFAILACGPAITSLAQAADADQPDKSREKLIVTVRSGEGLNKQEETLAPGKAVMTLPNGRKIEFQAEFWDFIGDLQIRFVFDRPKVSIGAMPADFDHLGLANVHDALELALTNLRRLHGEPVAKPWKAGVMAVHGKSPDMDSSYMADRDFWRARLKAHPEGLVVGVPNWSGLLFAPMDDHAAVDALKKRVESLYTSSADRQVSSALYLFKADKWTVFQPPAAPK